MNSKKLYDNIEMKTVLSTLSLTISTLCKKKSKDTGNNMVPTTDNMN